LDRRFSLIDFGQGRYNLAGVGHGSLLGGTSTREALMESVSTVQQRNREVAQLINAEARSDPRSPYRGKFVGLANGQVVVVADCLDEVVQRLRQVEPDAQRTFCLEAGLDYDAVQTVWGVH
jgi:hypothetical protein